MDLVDTKTADFLEEDAELRGQKYMCLSFISPEDVIASKEVYFLRRYCEKFSADVSELFSGIRDKFKDDDAIQDMVSILEQRYDYIVNPEEMDADFSFYKQENSKDLEAEYLKINNYQTTMRAIKVRGSYDTLVEAQLRAEQIGKVDDKFHVWVGQVGCWCPWNPSSKDVESSEYKETQLNTLMKKYKENLALKDQMFNDRTNKMLENLKSRNPVKIVEEE
jgi:hypothetical protein